MPKRVIKVADDAEAGLEVTTNATRLAGSRENFFFADQDGLFLVGSLSILTQPENIRIGTSFVFPTAYEAMLPSTTVNPQPMLIADLPVTGFASLASEVARLLAEIA